MMKNKQIKKFIAASLCGMMTVTGSMAVPVTAEEIVEEAVSAEEIAEEVVEEAVIDEELIEEAELTEWIDGDVEAPEVLAETDILIDQVSINQKSAQLMDALLAASSENTVISPYSIRMALTMLAEGAREDSQKELQEFLIRYAQDLELPEDVDFHAANSLWMNQDMALNQDYADKLLSEYKAMIESIDFTDESAPEIINQWVSEQTKGLIPELVDDSISDMEAVLINALYYKGAWQMPFEDSEVTTETFHSPDKEQEASMLNGYGDGWDYYENEQAAGFRIFYEDGFQFIGILPNEEDFQLADLDLDGLLASNDEWCTRNVELHYQLPEFKTTYQTSLTEALEQTGVENIFSDKADLSGIADNLKVSDVIHKTYIEVNQKGTEAAAATGIMMEAMMAPIEDPEPVIYKEVILNRPFIFLIQEPMSGELVFMGQISSVD